MADWTISDYGDVADAVFAKMDKSNGTAAVIAFGKNGEEPVYHQYPDSESASTAYDALVNAPTDRWYIALYDEVKSATPDGRVDQTYLGGVNIETVSVRKIKRPIAPIVATAGALGLAMLAAGGKRHRRGK